MTDENVRLIVITLYIFVSLLVFWSAFVYELESWRSFKYRMNDMVYDAVRSNPKNFVIANGNFWNRSIDCYSFEEWE